MSGSPASIVNRVLDALGRSDIVIGELGEGTEGAKPALRAYEPALRQLLRAAHWDWCRTQKPMALLGDATGNTPNVSTSVQAPWLYAYAWPIDCVKARFVPWNSNPITPVTPPLMTGLAQPALNGVRLRPAPFLIGTDDRYPLMLGAPQSWTDIPDWAAGTAPTTRSIILTNVPPQPQTNAPTVFPNLVYTGFIPYPSIWDPLFEEAFVNFLTQKLAMPLVKDKKLALAVQANSIKIAKDMISEARAVNANESGYPQTTDHTPDWIRGRNRGGGNYAGGFGGGYDNSNMPGILWGGWDSCGFSDGSVF